MQDQIHPISPVTGIPPYLQCQSKSDVNKFIPDNLIDYGALPDANVLVALKSNSYLLATVQPPNRIVKVYMPQQFRTVHAEVEQLFKIIQASAWCWCQI